ncbi:hypothetical protein FISHEDRAFT_59158 [Fistulina hepatica ATCC 64428]|uniref:Uncharacterized protein n=1 Tax=Fistulina hepatica ATCC 64428 TaxID=1128425 RepID=A0A0D7ABQ2_9AGAR|nr:hypothetical protein FISHEDRAFT_59158 [Fistulina hepatica ATCC 64428]
MTPLLHSRLCPSLYNEVITELKWQLQGALRWDEAQQKRSRGVVISDGLSRLLTAPQQIEAICMYEEHLQVDQAAKTQCTNARSEYASALMKWKMKEATQIEYNKAVHD